MLNATTQLPSASFHQPVILTTQSGIITSYVDYQHVWITTAVLVVSLILYDQCMHNTTAEPSSNPLTITDRYRIQKGVIPGAAVKFPFLGSLTQALNLTFDTFQARWADSPFTCMSVLNK